jgi:hypothetical protein
MDIKQFVCAAAYEFLKKHYNEIKDTPEELGFKNKADFLNSVKNNHFEAIWCIREVFTWGMDKDYCIELFIENEEQSVYKATYNGETRYYQLDFDDNYEVSDFNEVVKTTKMIEVTEYKSIN